MNFSKYKLRFLYLLSLPLLFLLSNFLPDAFFLGNREFQLVEIIQTIFLVLCLIINFKFRKIFIKVSNFSTFILRNLLILFLLYEELSFLTYSFKNTFNYQNEFNIHNSKILHLPFFNLTVPFLNIEFSPTLLTIFICSFFIILDYGSYFPSLKKFKYFFIEKEYAIFTISYLTLIFVNKFSFLNPEISNAGKFIINNEIYELFIYLVILLDTFKKIKFFKKESIKILRVNSIN